MFDVLLARIRSRAAAAVTQARAALWAAWRPRGVVTGFIADMTRSHAELVAENALLRQQLIVAARAVKRPDLRTLERGLLVMLAGKLPHWRDAMLLVKPDTILRWHREGFRLFWRWRSAASRKPKPSIDAGIIELIGRMARENGLWGAERIRGELLKLGVRVAKRTVQKYMRKGRRTPPRGGQTWRVFLRNHTVWACDFLQVYDVWFRPIFAFFIVDVNTKRVVHVGVTRHPTEQWTAQQLRHATPFGEAPRFIIRDRDGKFGSTFDRVANGTGMRVLQTAVRAPLMNSVCERFLGSVRRECLDHVLILGQRHLLHVLREYAVDYFNCARPHQGIAQQVPIPSERTSYSAGANVVAISVLGGLHNDYRVAA